MDEFLNRRAQVRVVDNQQEETSSTPVTGSEAEALLRKYYANNNHSDDNFRGFQGIEDPIRKPLDPRKDPNKYGEYTDTTYSGDGDIDLEIKITSTIPLPKR